MGSLKPEDSDNDKSLFAPLASDDGESWKAGATPLAKADEYAEYWLEPNGHLHGIRIRAIIARRFERLNRGFQSSDQDTKDEVTWRSLEASSRTANPADHRGRLAAILGELACKGDTAPYGRERARFFNESANDYLIDAPYVARALIKLHIFRLKALGDQFAIFRERLLSGRKAPTDCSGVADFSDYDWDTLYRIAPIQFQDSYETTTASP